MKTIAAIVAVLWLLLACEVIAQAAPDPWRVRVTDYALNDASGVDFWLGTPVRDAALGEWNEDGGVLRAQRMWGRTGSLSYDATTGAITFGTWVDMSVEGIGRPGLGGWTGSAYAMAHVGSLYKMMLRHQEFNGMEMHYSASSDGLNYSVPTRLTIYGSTKTVTGLYGVGGLYHVGTGSTYLMNHANDSLTGVGLATSGVGETVWWDIDTQGADGDPLQSPSRIGLGGMSQYGNQSRACNGGLIFARTTTGIPSDDRDWGVGLAVGPDNDLAGGDDYQWVCDTTSESTNHLPSLLGGIGLTGLSGPSLRVPPFWGTGWVSFSVNLAASENDGATEQLLLYCAVWDSDSSGGEPGHYDTFGSGHAKVLLTRNKADSNFDGTVDFLDVAPVSSGYGTSSGDPGYKEKGDLNGDGLIDESDVAILSNRYGSGCEYGM